MANSMLAAVRAATLAAADELSPEGENTGADAPHSKETDMSKDAQPAGGSNTEAGIPKADHDAAVATAEKTGRAAGAQEATERLSAAIGAEGVKGDAGRMSAALDLAVKSPGMSGADVAAFVIANVAAAKPAASADAAAYEKTRLAAAGLAQPGAKDASQDATSRILGNYRASTGAPAKQG